jgi:hypothetical protein
LTCWSLGKEYAKADVRWGMADPTVVSLEFLTVFGAGPLCVLLMYQIARNDPARYYNYIVLSVAELYGGWMTFCPEVIEWMVKKWHIVDTLLTSFASSGSPEACFWTPTTGYITGCIFG